MARFLLNRFDLKKLVEYVVDPLGHFLELLKTWLGFFAFLCSLYVSPITFCELSFLFDKLLEFLNLRLAGINDYGDPRLNLIVYEFDKVLLGHIACELFIIEDAILL